MTHDPDIQSGDTGVSNDESQDIWEGCFEEAVDYGTPDVKGTPLLDVLSISIQPKSNSINDDDDDDDDNVYKPWAIYGTFKTDIPNGNVVIYSQSSDNPEKISEIGPGGIFYLTLPNYGPICGLFPTFHADVELTDKIRNRILIQKPFVIDYKEYEYDTVQYKDIEDENATLRVKYVTYQAAVTATVEFVLRKKVGEDSDEYLRNFYVNAKDEHSLERSEVVEVEGTLIGAHHYTRSDFSDHSHGGSDCSCITLVTFPKDSPKITLGTSVPLSRSLLAVPAYSLFMIDIDLVVSGYGRVRNVAEFRVSDCGELVKNVEVPGGLICQFKVRWSHVYFELPDLMVTEKGASHESEKKMKVDDPNANSSTFTLYNIPLPLEFEGERLMEIFSISLGLKKDEFCNVYGRIEISDVLYEYVIYDKDESCPDKIPCGRTLSLRGPNDHCLASTNFILKADLKVDHQQLCKGYFCWSGFSLRKTYFDAFLCSVIKGESGYAAVHYAIFSSAVQAKLKIFFISSSDKAVVTGKVVTEYSEYEYEVEFDREYHRTVLFSATQGSPAMLVSANEGPIPLSSNYKGQSSDDRKLLKDSGIPLLLSRSLVCVPNDESLIVDVKVVATVETEESKSKEVGFSGRAELIIGREMCCVIESEGHQLCIVVDWDTVMRGPCRKKLP